MVILIILRIVAPALLFVSPWVGCIVNLFLDMIDGLVFEKAGFSNARYNRFDKPLDFYWYVWIMIYILANRATIPHVWLFGAFFIIRLIGQIGYSITENHMFYFYFPNIFEAFFWAYVLNDVTGWSDFRKTSSLLIWLAVVLAFKIPIEYFLHVAKLSVTNIIFKPIFGKEIMSW